MPISDWILVFMYGARLDLSTAGYILIIPGLAIGITAYFNYKIIYHFINIYTFIILLITSLITIADMELYRHWGFRLDSTPLLYLANPKEIAGSANLGILILQTGIWLVMFSLASYIYLKIFPKRLKSFKKYNLKVVILFFFMTATLILPIRGSFGVAPMNVGFVYFHDKNVFANHAAINVVWNAGYSLTKLDKNKASIFFDQKKADELFAELYHDDGETKKLINTDKPNVLIMIIESFTSKIIEPVGGLSGITPNFNKYCKEGILFKNIYSSGDRTDKAITAVLNGFPTHPTSSIIKFPKKTQRLPFINKDLKKLGYFTHFTYGYDIDYANFRSYLANAEFHKITSKADFDPSDYNSKWGVHDHIVFNKFFDEAQNSKAPFLKVLMSQSSHEPFTVPMETVIKGDDEENMFLNSAYYTDKALGEFIEKAKKTKWWKNTLIIIVADHGIRHPGNTPHYALKKFQIPMLWLGGAINTKDSIIATYCTQTDIPNTILKQIGVDSKQYKYSANILSSKSPDFGYYVFNNGFGFVKDSLKIIYDNIGKKYILQNGLKSEKDADHGKAYLQVLTYDFANK